MNHTVVERHHDEVKMNGKRLGLGILGMALLLAASGCNREAEAAPDAEDAKPAKDDAPASEAAPAKAPVKLTAGELSTDKKKLRFTIALPEGLREVHDGLGDGRAMVSYRKSEKVYDGYGITVGIESRSKEMLKPMKAALLAQLEVAKKTKKAAVLSQGDWDNGGWYFSGSFEEAGKPYVTMMSRIVVGDTVLTCRGDGAGEVAKTPEATARVLIDACKSLKVTSS